MESNNNGEVMVGPTTESVVAAISTLNHHPNPKEQEGASSWLCEFQKSIYAWKISDEILHAGLNEESSCFAAQTLRHKIQRSFKELPKESHVSLRDSLLEHIAKTSPRSRLVTTQLCAALADVVLLLPEWTDALRDLMTRITDRKVLLEVLTYLPEEMNSRYIHLGDLRRKKIEKDFKEATPQILELLKECCNSLELRAQTLKCFRSWIDIRILSVKHLEQNAVMGVIFQILMSQSSERDDHEAASEALTSVMFRIEEDCPPGSVIEVNLFTVIRNFEEPYHFAVASEDTEKALNYCRLFTEFGETMLDKIFQLPFNQQPHYAVAILDSILLCCGHPDYELPEITFNLWYRLSEELFRQKEYEPLFRPYIERLINALCKHCQMEPDSTNIISNGDFFSFRKSVGKLMKDIVFIVGPEEVFKYMYLNNIKCSSSTWEVLEASLYIMQSVASKVPPSEKVFVKQVLESIFSLSPETHIAVKSTSVELVGKLGNWVDGNPEYLERILNFMFVSIQNPKLSNEAANALLTLSSTCRSHMLPHYEGLLHIVKSTDNFSLSTESILSLLKGISILTSDLEPVQIHLATKTLLWLQGEPLNALADDNSGKLSDPTPQLCRLSAILQSINPKPEYRTPHHPCFPAIQEIWPVLAKVFLKYQSNSRYMEQCCRTIRYAIRCVGMEFAPLVEELVQLIVGQFKVYPHSCFLYLGSILVDEFAHIPGCIMGLLGMLQEFLEPTFALLREPNGLKNNPDTVDDFFRLNTRFIQRATVPYLQTSFLNAITECAIMAVSLDHREASVSLMKFLSTLFSSKSCNENKEDFGKREQLVSAHRARYGGKLIDKLINACIFNLSTSAFEDVSDVIFELIMGDRASVRVWLEASLNSLPISNSNGLQVVTKEKLIYFHEKLTSSSNTRDVYHAIREFYRLWE